MTDVVRKQTLPERINEMMHENIGTLITPEDLKEMIETGMRKALFEKRVTRRPTGYSGRMETNDSPSIVDELTSKYLETKMYAAVTEWLKANPDLLKKAIDEAIENGVASCMAAAMDRRFEGIMTGGLNTLHQQLSV